MTGTPRTTPWKIRSPVPALLVFGGEFAGNVLAVLYPVHAIVAPVVLLVVHVARFVLALRAGRSVPRASEPTRLVHERFSMAPTGWCRPAGRSHCSVTP